MRAATIAAPALVKADHAAYMREYGCTLGIEEFHRLYVLLWDELNAPKAARPAKTLRAMDRAVLRLAHGAWGAQLKANRYTGPVYPRRK